MLCKFIGIYTPCQSATKVNTNLLYRGHHWIAGRALCPPAASPGIATAF